MSTVQTSLAPFAALLDRLERKSEADSAALREVQATVRTLQNQVHTLQVKAASQQKEIDQLEKDAKVKQSLTDKRARQVNQLSDASVSHQAQLDSIVAQTSRKRNKSPAPAAGDEGSGSKRDKRSRRGTLDVWEVGAEASVEESGWPSASDWSEDSFRGGADAWSSTAE